MKKRPSLVRINTSTKNRLWEILFSRYPKQEWGTFVRFGWKETAHGLTLTLQLIDEPNDGDIDKENWMTEIQAQYSRRVFRLIQTHPYAVGFVHSHPEGYFTEPSPSDYDMESYYSSLFASYAPDRPFVSLIFSKEGENFSASGRVWWNDEWHEITSFKIEGCPVTLYNFEKASLLDKQALNRLKRFASVFSHQAAESLAGATVAVIGVSGTGSPIVELLARSSVGTLIVVDPKVFDDSNHERNHASLFNDLGKGEPKVLLSKRHIESINPNCKVIAIQGSIPQNEVVDYLLWADIVLGCTDLHSARIALTDLSSRYLVPVIDVGVSMEGDNGTVTGQIVQINRLFPDDACVFCRRMVHPQVSTQELMAPEKQAAMKTEAERAKLEGRQANAYWIDLPQLNTVGYLTTLAGSMVAAYTIGFLTGRFAMFKNRLEICLSPFGVTVVEKNASADPECSCVTAKGCADQDPLSIRISAPSHWPAPVITL